MSELKFNLKPGTQPVILVSDKGEESFEIREMMASDRDAHMDSVRSRVDFDAEGKAKGIKRFEGLQAELIARCLFRMSDGRRVIQAEIQKWPSSVVQALYDAAQKINSLGDTGKEAVEEAKNE